MEMKSLTAESLYRELVPRVGYIRAYLERNIPSGLKAVISADDLLQEVWIAADATVDTFQAREPTAVDRWLTRIARNKLISAVRAARAQKRGGGWQYVRPWRPGATSFSDVLNRLSSAARTPSHDAHMADAAQRVLIGLQSLNPRQRRAVELYYLAGRTREEVAREMGATPIAVKALLRRGLERMQEVLGPEAHFFTDARSQVTSRPDEDSDEKR